MDGEELGLIDGTGGEEQEIEGGEETFVEGEEGAEGGEEGGDHEGDQGGDEEGGEGGEEGSRRGERSTLPLQLRKALRSNPEIAKQFPKLEKQITGALFKANGVDQLGGLQKFREFSEALEAHGGPEGITALATEVENWRALDEGFERGDPRVLDGWVKDYPDGFKRLLGPAIEKLEGMDQAAHDQTLSVPMWKTLDRCGVISTLQALEGAISSNKIEDVAKEFKLLKGFFQELRSLAVKSKGPDPLAADRQRLSERETEVNETARKAFYGSVRQDVNTQVMGRMNKLIRQELGATKIKLSVANRLRREINAELSRVVNTQSGYQERYKAIMAAGDRERASRFIVNAATAKLPTVVRQLIAEFNIKKSSGGAGGNGSRARSEGGSRGGDRGERSSVVTGRPKTADVDFTRTDKAVWLSTMHSHGQAYLRNGKLAKW